MEASIFNEYLDYIRLKYMRHFVVQLVKERDLQNQVLISSTG